MSGATPCCVTSILNGSELVNRDRTSERYWVEITAPPAVAIADFLPPESGRDRGLVLSAMRDFVARLGAAAVKRRCKRKQRHKIQDHKQDSAQQRTLNVVSQWNQCGPTAVGARCWCIEKGSVRRQLDRGALTTDTKTSRQFQRPNLPRISQLLRHIPKLGRE